MVFICDELPLELSTLDVIKSLSVIINCQVRSVIYGSLPNEIDRHGTIELRDLVDDFRFLTILDGEFDGLACLLNLLNLYFRVLHNRFTDIKSFGRYDCRRLSLGGCDDFFIIPSKRISV